MTTMMEKAMQAFKDDLREQDVLWSDGEPASEFMMTRGSIANLEGALRAALKAVRGQDGRGVEMMWWSERVIDGILNEKPS